MKKNRQTEREAEREERERGRQTDIQREMMRERARADTRNTFFFSGSKVGERKSVLRPHGRETARARARESERASEKELACIVDVMLVRGVACAHAWWRDDERI